MASTSRHVLILGGHGKIAMHLTPLLLRRSWTVTSVVRNPDHRSEIEELAQGQPGKLNVLISSLGDVTSEEKAKEVIDKVKPDYIAWSAGMSTLSYSQVSTGDTDGRT